MLSSLKAATSQLRGGSPRVLFLSAERRATEGSRLYRCAYQVKQLRQAGVSAEAMFVNDATPMQLAAADMLILARCRVAPHILEVVRNGRAAGKLVLGELDDRVFAPWDVDGTGFLRSRATEMRDLAARVHFASAEAQTLQLLAHLDLVLVSTPTIKAELEQLGIPARVFRNAIDTEVVPPVRRPRFSLRKMLVMTGTRTHDADLRSIAKPLARFLVENPGITCTFLGPLELSSSLRGLANVKRRELLPIAELYGYISEFDLCLVPLEKSVFNDCKSALKFIECGVVSVPVLASPRAEFRALIRDGENGLLASDEPESWYQQLSRLRDDPSLLQRVSLGAFETVQREHTVTSRGDDLASFLQDLFVNHASAQVAE